MFVDPKIKARVRKYLAQTSNLHYSEIPECDLNVSAPTSPATQHNTKKLSAGSQHFQQQLHQLQQQRSAAAAALDLSCRKSRIPTIIKSPVHTTSKNGPQSPQGQRIPKLSNIPTANGTTFSTSTASAATTTTTTTTTTKSSSATAIPESKQANTKQRFEAYMMTGDLILNLSRTQQSSDLITTHSKKVKYKYILFFKYFIKICVNFCFLLRLIV